ncbi:SDR family NAD(P)-dependent oxidoreductase [Metabacillus herbersteinensis]|uniref:SDR family NAD(P)-dependent oxidoreductase n=1 Tax=Metabacillus herbersteinensis TaxID=283816 RepID=A0ABV6GFX5_9BACI
MKKALVVGASGGMGYSIVKELSNRGIAVVAFARTRKKLENLFEHDPKVEIVTGDIFQTEDLLAASNGVDVIFQSANIPYTDWEEKLATFIGNIVNVAEIQGAKLALVDNIYAYGRSKGGRVTEITPKNPHTKKGKIRLQVEGIVKNSTVPALIAHFPDFYGPNAENTLMHYMLQNVVKSKKASYVGDQNIKREFIYTPDGAKAIVNLALREDAYGQNWNIPGCGVITGVEIVKHIREIVDYRKPVSTVSKNMIKLLGIFSGNMREVIEMFYLNEQPVVLSGKKYEALIGKLPQTSYHDGLRETIEFMRNK